MNGMTCVSRKWIRPGDPGNGLKSHFTSSVQKHLNAVKYPGGAPLIMHSSEKYRYQTTKTESA